MSAGKAAERFSGGPAPLPGGWVNGTGGVFKPGGRWPLPAGRDPPLGVAEGQGGADRPLKAEVPDRWLGAVVTGQDGDAPGHQVEAQ
jgi:hypothetical protein